MNSSMASAAVVPAQVTQRQDPSDCALDRGGRYFIGFDAQAPTSTNSASSEFQGLAGHGTPHAFNRWYQIEIVLQDSTITFLVDGTPQ
jgi:hypothetical protein